MKTCKCGTKIKFLKMQTGKTMPVDAEQPLKVVVPVSGTDTYRVATGYTPHFATCPLADQFRKKQRFADYIKKGINNGKSRQREVGSRSDQASA